MWFTKEQLWTDALKKVVQSGTNPLEKEIRDVIVEQFLLFALDEVQLTPKDILELLKNENGFYGKKTQVTEVLKHWGYEANTKPDRYKRWRYELMNDGTENPFEFSRTGRFYTFKKSEFLNNL